MNEFQKMCIVLKKKGRKGEEERCIQGFVGET